MLKFYSVFHLNLAYSSIEEEQRPEVIQRCYWPLLKLAQDYSCPLGIELSAYTLETIASIDGSWIARLRDLVMSGACELIGSGYAQMIGPLVPAEVNAANLRFGNQGYEKILGFQPKLALVNEQAYSAGLLTHYLNAGYRAIIMEWDNPARYHPEWNPIWRYLPQIACGQHGEEIALLWSHSIAFQKFQRYAHSEIELEEYISYLEGHLGPQPRIFPLYANDAEIFDFRPGRYHTEAPLHTPGEWKRIYQLFDRLSCDKRLIFIRPSQALELIGEEGAGNRLQLESSEQPIPVKKQGKYNVTRWAVTGCDSMGINTACWKIYNTLKSRPSASNEDWRELCFLWSSDFRTHITERRWTSYKKRLDSDQSRMATGVVGATEKTTQPLRENLSTKKDLLAKRQGRYLTVETRHVQVRLNCNKGLAIDGLWLGSTEGPPLCGTLAHGYYDDIAWGADWYSGHIVLETQGESKITDLNPVEPNIEKMEGSDDIVVSTAIPTRLGKVQKRVQISATEPMISLSYRWEWEHMYIGSFRLGHITLHPMAFERASLFYQTCNGGTQPENFPLDGTHVSHGDPVSFLVSASGGVGMTGGWIAIGDRQRRLRVEADQTAAAVIGLISYQEIGNTYFCRLALSAGEMDDTQRQNRIQLIKPKNLEFRFQIFLQI